MTYKYDALGRRVQRTPSNGVSTNFIYDGQDVVKDINSDGTTVEYLNGPGIDNKIRQKGSTSSTTYYFSQDHLGSTTALTGTTGKLIERQTYDAYGNSAGSTRTRYGFTGRERDPLTGLHYYRARFYDPEVGRFMSEDPIGFIGGINVYAYVENNPVIFSDPLGLQKGCCNKTWSECWGQCIENHRLDNLLLTVGTSVLPKRVVPPFRVVKSRQRTTTVLSSAGHLLRNVTPGLARDLRGIGRSFSRGGTPLLVFEGFYDLGIIGSCAELCHRNPCN